MPVRFNPSEYKISGNYIIRKTAGFVPKHENCTIFDIDNWVCGPHGKKGFGFMEGKFFENPKGDDTRIVSRFQYNVIGCKYDLLMPLSSLQFIACPLRFFIE